jgi:hypothetical protein
MFTQKDSDKLKLGKVEYDFRETEEEIKQPILKPLVKISKQAVPFTMEDIYKYKNQVQSEIGKSNQVKEQLLKTLAEQEARLTPYDIEFSVDMKEIWKDGDFQKLDQFMSAPYVLKMVEAIDIVRYIKGLNDKIAHLDSDIEYYNAEVVKYDEEIARVNEALDIEHLERQYQAQCLVDNMNI